MSNKDTEEMEAKNIAHLVGRMDAILYAIEIYIQKVVWNDYQGGYLRSSLIEQVNQAKVVNEKIFEMYKKDRLDRIKKTYRDENE